MLFFPYRAELEQWRFPVVTLLICAICAIVLANQFGQKSALQWHAVQTCYLKQDRELATALQYMASRVDMQPERMCKVMMVRAYVADDAEQALAQWAYLATASLSEEEKQRRDYIYSIYLRAYNHFSTNAPMLLTENMWFDPAPESLSALKMVSSVFAHHSVLHLLGNLFFFFAFAATVEVVIGSLSMLATVVLLALLTNTFYAMMSTFEGVYIPTLGLSGVVFGMMGMFVCFLPQARVRCFAWLVVFFRRPAVPAWLLVGGYVLWNVYSWWQAGGNNNVNFIVHISGALFGYLIALTVFRISKQQYSTTTTVRNSRRYLSASVNQ